MSRSVDAELCRHAAALRGLARALVGTDHADDLLQDAALRAVQRGLRPRTRGFWRQLLRHLAGKHHRAAARRRRHELAAAPPSPLPAPDAAAMQRDTLRLLDAALLGLPEPYQSTLLLRYFRDLTPTAIAAQGGVPLPTVKSRLQRGLAMLRQRLEADGGGDWRAALAAFAAGGNGKLAATLLGGILLMGNGVKLAAAGIAAAVLFVAWWSLSPAAPASPAGAAGAGSVAAARAAPPPPVADAAEVQRTAAPPAAAPVAAAGLTTIRGRCVDANGKPRAGIEAALRGWESNAAALQPTAALERAQWTELEPIATGADGRFEFRFRGSDRFAVQLYLTTADYQSWRALWSSLPPGDVHDLGDLVLAERIAVNGRVVDTTGVPQAGAEVQLRLQGFDSFVGNSGEGRLVPMSRSDSASTAADGTFTVRLQPGVYRADVAKRRLQRQADFEVGKTDAPLLLVIAAADSLPTIRGRVVDTHDRPVAVVHITTMSRYGASANAVTDRDGRFTLVQPERAADAPVPLFLSANGYEELRVEDPVAWGTNDLVYTLRAGIDLEVEAKTPDGAPLRDFALFLAPIRARETLGFEKQQDCLDEDGIARVHGMLRGDYWLRLVGDGICLAAKHITIADPGPVRVQLTTSPIADLLLRVRTADGSPVAGAFVELLEPFGQEVRLDTLTLPTYDIDRIHSDGTLAELLQAGRTDAHGELRLHGPARGDLALRVRSPDWQPRIVQPFTLGDQAEATVQLAAGASLTVRLEPAEVLQQWRTAAGLPATGPMSPEQRASAPAVRAWHQRPGGAIEYTQWQRLPGVPFDDDGVCRLGSLPPGKWHVELWLSFGANTGGLCAPAGSVQLREGEPNELRLRLPQLALGTLHGCVRLNGELLAGARIQATAKLALAGQELSLSATAIADAAGGYDLSIPALPASTSIYAKWPGSGEPFSVDLPGTVCSVAGERRACDLDVRMGRVRFACIDDDGKPVAGVRLGLFADYREWPEATDASGRTAWTPLVAGRWQITALPRRLLEHSASEAFRAAHAGEGDPYATARIDLGSVEVGSGNDREVEVRVPEAWFR